MRNISALLEFALSEHAAPRLLVGRGVPRTTGSDSRFARTPARPHESDSTAGMDRMTQDAVVVLDDRLGTQPAVRPHARAASLRLNGSALT